MLNPITHRRILRKGVPGHAQILEMEVPSTSTSTLSVPMRMRVFLEGHEPFEVEGHWWAKVKDTAKLRGRVAVRVDAADRTRVAIDWDATKA